MPDAVGNFDDVGVGGMPGLPSVAGPLLYGYDAPYSVEGPYAADNGGVLA